MALLRLLKPYDLKQPGETITVTGTIASVLILNRTAELVREPQDAVGDSATITDTSSDIIARTTTLTVGHVSKSETIVYRNEAAPVDVDAFNVVDSDQVDTLREAVSGLRWALETSEARLVLAKTVNELLGVENVELKQLLEDAAKPEVTELPTDAEPAAWEALYTGSATVTLEGGAKAYPNAINLESENAPTEDVHIQAAGSTVETVPGASDAGEPVKAPKIPRKSKTTGKAEAEIVGGTETEETEPTSAQ